MRAHDLASHDASISVAGSGNVEVAAAARCTVSRIGTGNVGCADMVRETEIGFR